MTPARLVPRDFYQGVIAALAVVARADQETLFREIVRSCGEKALLAEAAREPGTFEWSGFAQYGYRKPKARRARWVA